MAARLPPACVSASHPGGLRRAPRSSECSLRPLTSNPGPPPSLPGRPPLQPAQLCPRPPPPPPPPPSSSSHKKIKITASPSGDRGTARPSFCSRHSADGLEPQRPSSLRPAGPADSSGPGRGLERGRRESQHFPPRRQRPGAGGGCGTRREFIPVPVLAALLTAERLAKPAARRAEAEGRR